MTLALRLLLGTLAVVSAAVLGILILSPGFLNHGENYQVLSLLGASVTIVWIASIFAVYRLPLWAVLIGSRLLIYPLFIGAVFPANDDPAHYIGIAQSIIDGEGMARGHLRALFPPFYPFLLGAVGYVTGTSAAYMLVNAAADYGAAMAILALARRVDVPGRWAAAAYLVWPQTLLGAFIPQKEGLAVLFVLLVTILMFDALQRRSWKTNALLGLTIGALALTQPGLATYPLCLGLFLMLRTRIKEVMMVGLQAAPFTIAVLSIWWVRNWFVFGTFVPLTTATGISMLVAFTGTYSSFKPLLQLPELQMQREATQLAIDYISAHPVDAILHRIRSIAAALAVNDFVAIRMGWIRLTFEPLILACQFLHVALLSFAARNLKPGALSLIVAAAIVQALIFGLPFEFAERHRFQLTPLLLLAVAMSGRSIITKHQWHKTSIR